MYQGRTLQNLAQELDRQAMVKNDFKAPTNLMTMSVRNPEVIHKAVQPSTQPLPQRNPELEFSVGDKFIGGMTPLMHEQLGSHLGIPRAYYQRMQTEQPSLLVENANTWLRSKPETRLVRTLDGNARAFLSNRYRTIDNYDVANAALPVLINESKQLGSIETVSAEVTDRKLYIKVLSKRLTFDIKKGDAVQAGIVISNSEVGLASVRVEPLLFRLICLNGAIIEDSAVRKFHLGRESAELEAAEAVFRDETRRLDDRAFMSKLQDVVRAAFDSANFEKLKGITIDSTTRKIKAPIQDVMEEGSDRYHLTEGHRNSFLNNLIEGGDITQWGLANALTAVANKSEDYETATRLERLGGELITMDGKAWRELADAA